jgi:DNA repair exonuclease SbcCD nuclease subunit
MTFKKAIVAGDIHFGKKANSDLHNVDCLDAIDWMIAQAKAFQAETFIFCGDWTDTRSAINIRTLKYSVLALEKLSAAFENSYIVIGNHDTHNKSSIDIHSLCWAHHISGIHVIEKTTVVDDCTFVPWIADNNFEQLRNISTRYAFAHLELSNFYMNANALLPSHECQADAEMFDGPEYIFTGHFHKRQLYKNKHGAEIIYIGSALCHNYSDVNDDDRGCVLLENGQEPIFVNWEDGPKYRVENLSDLLETPENILTNKTHLRVHTDLELPYDEINFIRDTLQKQFGAREIVILPKRNEELFGDYADANVVFKSVDNIVLAHIDALDTASFDKSLLHTIYTGL